MSLQAVSTLYPAIGAAKKKGTVIMEKLYSLFAALLLTATQFTAALA
jgi:hypothetical protein